MLVWWVPKTGLLYLFGQDCDANDLERRAIVCHVNGDAG